MALAGSIQLGSTGTFKIGPFVDSTNGDSAETGLTIAQADVRLSKNGGNMAQKSESTTCTHDELGMYDCPYDATDSGTLGILTLNVQKSGALPVRHDYHVVTEVDYAGRTQVGAISTVGGGATGFSANTDNVLGAIKSISFVGVQTTGTFADTATINGYHVIDDTANEIDIVYGFDVGGGKIASDINFEGYLSNANDTLNVLAYNFVTPGWDQIGTLGGQGGTTNQNNTYLLLVRNTGTGADAGLVYIRFQNTGQTNPTLNTDRLLLSAVSNANTIGYENAAVWLDTGASNTNTESFVDGTADNPVSTIAAAKTIADNLNLKRIQVVGGSSFTLAAAFDNFAFTSDDGYSIALGGQSLNGATIENATVTGNDDGSNTTRTIYRECLMGDNTLGLHALARCALGGDIILAEAGTYDWFNCASGVAGTATPSVDVGAALGDTNLNVRNYSGGIELKNFGAAGTDNASIEGRGQVVLNANCTGGTLAIRGLFTLTDNSATTTISQDARFDTLNVMQGAVEGTTTMQDSLKLQNAGNAGKVSGAGTTNVKIRDLADTLDRIDATVDSDGNRSTVTRDLS